MDESGFIGTRGGGSLVGDAVGPMSTVFDEANGMRGGGSPALG